jgi:hypothetical protein
MLSMAQTASGIFAPVLGALLIGYIDVGGVMMIDVVTFIVAITTLLMIHVPQPPVTEAGRRGSGNILKESTYGFRYILERPSLLGLQLVFFSVNLISTFSLTVQTPMILSRTGDNEFILGSVMSAGAIGGLLGSLFLSVWGGPRRKVHGILVGMALSSLFGQLLMGFGQSVYIWAIAAFSSLFFSPIINGSNQAIWQAKVAPDVQGRVFSVLLLIAWITVPVAQLIAGPLADHIFEPAMSPGGSLAPILGGFLGTGPGAGMSVMFIIAGVLGVVVGLVAYAFPGIKNAEDILPDYEIEHPAGST